MMKEQLELKMQICSKILKPYLTIKVVQKLAEKGNNNAFDTILTLEMFQRAIKKYYLASQLRYSNLASN